MQLPPEQTARFYRIWLALLRYVNEQLHLVPAFPATEERAKLLPLSDELQLRNALWADDTLRARFISANPAGLPSADLAVPSCWILLPCTHAQKIHRLSVGRHAPPCLRCTRPVQSY